ncbi:MAG: hypothetical protein NXH95_13740 [Pseudomonadaceae bacterium]|nr:hypothetical protein [Pseudomonadaceae bacterium]
MPWPLGPLLKDGHVHSVEPTTIRTEFETGPARKKRFSSDQVNRLSGSVYLPNQLAVETFWTHWDGEANQGADWFDMPIVTQGVEVDHEVRIDNPQIIPYGRGYRLSIDVETRERNAS